MQADIYSKSKRSEIMSNISGKETKPEILVRKYLFSKGFRFRKNVNELPGKPDIVLPKFGVVILVHGCFWHGHSCKKGKLPSSNVQFWKNKISQNINRDVIVIKRLNDLGWRVFVLWQCEIRNKLDREVRLNQLIQDITKNK